MTEKLIMLDGRPGKKNRHWISRRIIVFQGERILRIDRLHCGKCKRPMKGRSLFISLDGLEPEFEPPVRAPHQLEFCF